jgi:aryl-alcohol dehydrogenase-like predicted oxidoreductase
MPAIGTTELDVFPLCLGGNVFGWTADERQAFAVLDAYADAGGNLVDTADSYTRWVEGSSGGESETIIGRWMAARGNRDRIVVATKVGKLPARRGLAAATIRAAADESLQRLATDRIDLYYAHEDDPDTPIDETLGAFGELIAAGKVRYIGASNYAGWQLMKALGLSDRLGYERFVSQQIHYSLQSRDAENELVPLSLDQGLGILVWSPIAGGLLSGKYRRGVDAPAGSRPLSGWDEPPVYDEDQLYDIVDELVTIAEARGVPVPQVALAYTLVKPGVTSVIVGARTDEQLRENLGAAELELSDDELARLDAVSRPHLPYPHWHQLKTSDARFNEADWALHRGRTYGE